MKRSPRQLRQLERSQLSRRGFVAFSGLFSSMVLTSQHVNADLAVNLNVNPFTLGVASGDPDHRGFVLWTRLAPEPLEPSGGMPIQNVEVHWEVATDEQMKSVVASGTHVARPALGHSVHVELTNLKPDRWYWYRFRCGDAESTIGRARTMPHPDSQPEKVRFGVTSCQNYEQGLYTAYEQMAKDELDLVFHLGDYIYEYAAGRNGKVRTHHGQEIMTLDDYRSRYAQYRSDPLLQNMHAQCPWILTWDDHEFDNNCAGEISEQKDVDPVDFMVRRANAYQAYYEMMPLRIAQMPTGSDMRLYRSAQFGQLANFMVLDTRQYRSDQPNNDKKSPLNEAAWDKKQSMLGREQRGWLSSQMIQSQANWNVLAQQVMMGTVNRSGDNENPQFSMDQWPGYLYERKQMVEFMRDRKIANPVVLTGDIHTNWVNELRVDDRNEGEATVATEFVATSLTSGGNGTLKPKRLDAVLANNPCVKYHNAERGYIRCEVTPKQWKSDYMTVDEVTKPGGKTFERASFVVESGAAKVHNA
ncbi:alkaline phosphatase D family protein [Rhodopirellula sp. MGV]|uniref:alkaline phosphatase D family protein n=1 Tax=Rhodopirellula sp. MGV TaxID=2023130 RepID=UPI000B977746|nr:alkaline phosphatase D family protein [Rhodopirellula sp. MGV]OYP36804.1 alkaline phosphatase [Rhodopirellula sp. MGV]PNY36487.1 alkaline phosphatase [Rhodopirellula baltica]